MAENLKKIQKIIDAFEEESLTKTDFVENFEKVVDLVLSNQQKLEDGVQRLEQLYDGLVKTIADKHDVSLSDLKKQTNELFVAGKLDEMSAGQRTVFNTLKEDFSSLVDKKLKHIDFEVARRAIKGDKGDTGIGGRSATEMEIQMAITPFIESLKKELNEIIRKSTGRRITSGPNANAVQLVDLTDQCDGVRRTFNVPTHRNSLLLTSSQWPHVARPTVDFTIGSGNITMTEGELPTVERGQTLLYLYVK